MSRSRRSSWLLAVSPWRAIPEAWVFGATTGTLLILCVGSGESNLLMQGALFISSVAALFAALRWSPPNNSSRWKRLWRELFVSTCLSFCICFGLLGPGLLLDQLQLLKATSLDTAVIAGLLLASGPMAFCVRVAIRIWLQWDHLRKSKLVWSLTHAHLVLVVGLAALMALPLAFFAVMRSSSGSEISGSDPLALAGSTLAHVLVTILPTGLLVIGFLLLTILVVLPPAAFASYFVARRSTRRIEGLALATAALRSGSYETRVAVDGEDELGMLQENFNGTAAELQRTLGELAEERNKVDALLQAQKELTAGVSHELRTPIATIQGYLEPALERWGEQSPEDLRQDLEIVRREIDRLGRLIDDLLALSRAGAGALEMHPSPVAIRSIADRVCDALGPLAWDLGRVEVAVEFPVGLPDALADPDRVQQILTNLVRNAVHHTPPGGFVVITGDVEPGAVRVEVRDTGRGIAPEDLPHIWQRYYRGALAGRDAGSGLGLAIVKELAEAMGGRVAVDSVVGEGSVFTVWLPRTRV